MIQPNHFPSREEVTAIVVKNGLKTRFDQLETAWEQALIQITELFKLDSSTQPAQQLASSSQTAFTRTPGHKLLIGLAGPGAVGKGTIGAKLLDDFGFSKIVNTTTRPAREGEIDGVHYKFTDLETFQAQQSAGAFASSLERPGRGWYGVEKAEITQKLHDATTGCLFEENPENIIKIFQAIDLPQTDKVLVYLLPPEPIIASSAQRLIYRLSQEPNSAKRQLTAEVFESTLGQRQIDEFGKLSLIIDQPDVQLLVLINAQLETTLATLRQLLQ